MPLLTRIIYVILFILLLSHPHFITGHIFSLSQAYAQSLTTLTLVGIALVVYVLHKRDVNNKENEKNQLEHELNISSNKLSDAYKYIGTVNRRLPLLNNITTGLLKQPKHDKKRKKEILDDLLATATVSLANTTWGIFHFIETRNNRTIREFVYTTKNYTLLNSKVSNVEILQTRKQPKRISKIDELYTMSTSDQQAPTQCFYIFPKGKNKIQNEMSTLQAIVDQAQLIYQYLYEPLS